jgi:glucan-binding YG repeat protein
MYRRRIIMKKRLKKVIALALAAICISQGAGVTTAQACEQVDNGNECFGWYQNEIGWWYCTGGDSYIANRWEWIGSGYYYFDSNGYMVTGWFNDHGIWYYLEESGKMAVKRWIGDYYVGSGGSMQTSSWIDGYYVGADGKWVQDADGSEEEADRGWKQDSTGWWFVRADGSYPVNEWASIVRGSERPKASVLDNEWYYFDSSGYMVTGWKFIGNEWYYFAESGKMRYL